MPLIFDSFPAKVDALRLMVTVAQLYPELDSAMYVDVDAAQAADPTPVELVPPIVHIGRSRSATTEVLIEQLAERFNGRVVGT